MKRIERSALVPYVPQRMFDLINDIASYPQFMPGCAGSEVLQEGDGWLVARLDLSRAGIKQSFVTRNTLTPPQSITLKLEQGPFSALTGQWEFQALGEDACKVSFWLEFEFANRLVGLAAGKLFEKVASDQVDAVCKRAKVIYG